LPILKASAVFAKASKPSPQRAAISPTARTGGASAGAVWLSSTRPHYVQPSHRGRRGAFLDTVPGGAGTPFTSPGLIVVLVEERTHRLEDR